MLKKADRNNREDVLSYRFINIKGDHHHTSRGAEFSLAKIGPGIGTQKWFVNPYAKKLMPVPICA